jgi:hypothetical protein
MAKRKKLKVDTVCKSSRLDEKLIDQFCEQVIKWGMPAGLVCDYLSISGSAYYHWRNTGSKYLDGGHEPPEHALYGLFEQKIRWAFAVYTQGLLKGLKGKDWWRNYKILERRDRPTWGFREPSGGDQDKHNPEESFM